MVGSAEAGANPNLTNPAGETALDLARQRLLPRATWLGSEGFAEEWNLANDELVSYPLGVPGRS